MTAGVSVVVPVYRTDDEVPELLRRVEEALQPTGRAFEVVLVDDASPDGAANAERAARSNPAVRLLRMRRNQGQHRAVLTGFRHARLPWWVSIDGDLQDPPEAVPALLAEAERRGLDAVFAGRRGRYQPLRRRITSRAFKQVLAAAAGVPADAGMFFAVHERAAARLRALDEPGAFVVAMVGLARLSHASLPVTRETRVRGSSAYSSRARLAAGWGALHYVLRRRCRRPLKPLPAAEELLVEWRT